MPLNKKSSRYQRGIERMREHLGPDADQYVEAISEVAPLFAKVNVETAFGELYGEDDSLLDQKTRELITVGALTVQGFSMPQLKLHIESALRVGASKEAIVETITQMIAYCGFPAATNAIMVAKAVFQEQGLL